MNSITREDWWLEKPEYASLKENVKKKGKNTKQERSVGAEFKKDRK